MKIAKTLTAGFIAILTAAIMLAVGNQYVGGQPPNPNDTFDTNSVVGSTLNGKWDIVSGSVGTVNPIYPNSTTPTLDISSNPLGLAVQVEDNSVALRQDYELANGDSIILTLAPAVNPASNVEDEIKVGIRLNSNDNAPTYGNGKGYVGLELVAIEDSWLYESISKNSLGAIVQHSLLGGNSDQESIMNGMEVEFRISRVDFNGNAEYHTSLRTNGGTWIPIKKMHTGLGTLDNIWITFLSYTSSPSGNILPTQLVYDIRFETTGI